MRGQRASRPAAHTTLDGSACTCPPEHASLNEAPTTELATPGHQQLQGGHRQRDSILRVMRGAGPAAAKTPRAAAARFRHPRPVSLRKVRGLPSEVRVARHHRQQLCSAACWQARSNRSPSLPRHFFFRLVSPMQRALSPMDDPSAPVPAAWVAAAASGGSDSGSGLADLLDAAAKEVPPAAPDTPASRTSTWASSSLTGCGAPPPPNSERAEPAPAKASRSGAAAATACDVDARGSVAVLPPPSSPSSAAVTAATALLSPERLDAAVRIVATAEWHRHHLPGGYRGVDYAESDGDAAAGDEDGAEDGSGGRGEEKPSPGKSLMECAKEAAGPASAAAAAEPTNEYVSDEELTDEVTTDEESTISAVSESARH